MTTISGVIVKKLDIAEKENGSIVKVMENSNIVGKLEQILISPSPPGTIKAFHVHSKQNDFWYALSGNARVVLYDLRENSQTYRKTDVVFMGDWYDKKTLFIPASVAHGYQVLGNRDLVMLYMLNHQYDTAQEGRIPYDDPNIGFDWSIKQK